MRAKRTRNQQRSVSDNDDHKGSWVLIRLYLEVFVEHFDVDGPVARRGCTTTTTQGA